MSEEVDYKALLAKYIWHVSLEEGVDFIGYNSHGEFEFTEQEKAALEEAAKVSAEEIRGEPLKTLETPEEIENYLRLPVGTVSSVVSTDEGIEVNMKLYEDPLTTAVKEDPEMICLPAHLRPAMATVFSMPTLGRTYTVRADGSVSYRAWGGMHG